MAKRQKTNLTLAFEELRKLGYFARQNFRCCQSCGWYAVPEEKSSKTVFFHGQDAADLKEKGSCYISWDGNGEEIVSVFNKHGIKTKWDGDKAKRIKIIVWED